MKVTRKGLATALAIVFVVNLVVMSAGALYSYQNAPPIPDEIVGPDGETVATDGDVRAGKAVFQSNGLMNHGSILGNGAYFGVDYTADALALKAAFMQEYYAQAEYGQPFTALSPGQRAAVNQSVTADLDAAYDGGPIEYSAAELYAHRQVRETYVARYHEGAPERGVPEGMIESAADARRFADFALWTAWMAHTERPGTDHSYTNDWPYNPLAGNTPTGGTMVWSAIAMILLIAAAGGAVWVYQSAELEEPEIAGTTIPDPGDVSLLPSQRAASRFIPVGAFLFVGQVLLGALLAHYYVERHAFFGLGELLGVDVLQWLPFAVAKTYHLDLGILWIATLWLGAGLFLPGLLTGHEPPGQARLVTVLLGALVVVLVGGFVGVWLGFKGVIGVENPLWWIVGNEGLEYVEVGRLWQFGLLAGFAFWAWLAYRGFRPLLDRESRFGLAHMILYAGVSIGLLFVAGMLYTPQTNIVMTEFWRWWVVHMWVEGAF
ncbi:MAG: cytochrome B, partial [Halobacteriaceae archaeon]